jgi:hypothetical protein
MLVVLVVVLLVVVGEMGVNGSGLRTRSVSFYDCKQMCVAQRSDLEGAGWLCSSGRAMLERVGWCSS